MSLFMGTINGFVDGVMGQLREYNNIDAYEELHACLNMCLRTYKEQKKNKQKYLDKIADEITDKIEELCAEEKIWDEKYEESDEGGEEESTDCCIYITSLTEYSEKMVNADDYMYQCEIRCLDNNDKMNIWINSAEYSFDIEINGNVYGTCNFHKEPTTIESNFKSNFTYAEEDDATNLDDSTITVLKVCAQIGQLCVIKLDNYFGDGNAK